MLPRIDKLPHLLRIIQNMPNIQQIETRSIAIRVTNTPTTVLIHVILVVFIITQLPNTISPLRTSRVGGTVQQHEFLVFAVVDLCSPCQRQHLALSSFLRR
jgi:uncharacterized membrane protein YqhA